MEFESMQGPASAVTSQPHDPAPSGLIMHIALQGCLKAGSIQYGVTADTGGHIRYLLELAEALADRPEVSHQIIVTRAFDDPQLGPEYTRPEEQINDRITLWRCRGEISAYLPKEQMWKEVPQLTQALLQRMQDGNIRPMLIHAHYADAGVVAMRVKSALSIPVIFTGHSLGASKAMHRPVNTPIAADLRRRIRYEELAIKHADRVIVSSRHEACVQYGQYAHHDATKIRLNPPGCDLKRFRATAETQLMRQVDAELRRFLRVPDRPCLLAIARPVEKKNLCALVKAYGEHPQLRHKANLVIFAGTRQQIDSGEPEASRVWNQLIQLIDDYDLYGCVALPKYHTLDQIPVIYRWAVERRGVFVNPALSEPFGLTLLEAAAVGLPVVSTQDGGPVDILRRCKHGELVSPTDINAIGAASNHLVSNAVDWQRYSTNGYRNVEFYTWERHARQYIADFKSMSGDDSIRAGIRSVSQLLATDMDGTLLGDRAGLRRLSSWLSNNPKTLFVVATGRSADAALRELRAWNAPLPDFLIADVGSSIYRMDASGRPQLISSWHRHLAKDWRRADCELLLSPNPSLTLQPRSTQTPFKLSFFMHQPRTNLLVGIGGSAPTAPLNDRHNEQIAKKVENCLAAAGLRARTVHSHGNFLDILPVASGKALAVDFLRKRFGIHRGQVVAAGDSGNDADLLRYAACGIVVANYSRELETLRAQSGLYWARNPCAAGVLEGLQQLAPTTQPRVRKIDGMRDTPAFKYSWSEIELSEEPIARPNLANNGEWV